MVRVLRVGLIVAFVVALGACSSTSRVDTGMAPGSSTTAPSTSGAPLITSAGGRPGATTWGTCLTRLAYKQAGDQITSPDRAERAEGLATLRGLPVPSDLAPAWATMLSFSERFDELAAEVNLSDPEEFSDAMYKAMRSEPTFTAMAALSEGDTDALSRVGADPPCDPAGLPDGFGCTDPEACTQAWAAAAHDHDQAALERLAQRDLTGDKTPAPSLTAIACEPAGPFTTCTGHGVPAPGSDYTDLIYKATWAQTTDGRWYGVSVGMSKFKAVASAIG